jgi:hypothetical protein
VRLIHLSVANWTGLALNLGQICLRNLHVLLVLREKLLSGMFREAPLDHLLNLKCFHSEEVENHVVRQPKLRAQFRRLAQNHVSKISSRRYIVRASRWYNNDRSDSIKSATPSSPGHLRILSRQQVSERVSIMLAKARENDCARGQIETHGKGLCCE